MKKTYLIYLYMYTCLNYTYIDLKLDCKSL